MNPNCIAEVAKAVGRALTKAEIQMVEDGLARTMRNMARTDPNWQSMSGSERLKAASDAAQREAIAEANKAADRRASNLLAQSRETARLNARAAALAANGKKNPYHAAVFERMLAMDTYISGERNLAYSNMVEALESVSPDFLGWVENPVKVREFARAVIDGASADPDMMKAAKVYLTEMDRLRQRANSAGASIGELDYGYVPQNHDVGKVARAGQDAWVESVLPKLDRRRYVKADGAVMGDNELIDLLKGAWESISTEGRNKMTPGQSRGGSRASSWDDKHRAIHFANADAYLAYQQEFGRGGMMSAIQGHVGQMAKSIGMMEEFGSNPNTTYRLLKDTAEKMDNRTGARASGATLDMVWDTLSGTASQPVSPQLAKFFQGIRNFTTGAKLGGVMLSAVTDAPSMVMAAKSSGMPTMQALKSLGTGWGKNARETAHALGIGLDEVASEMALWDRSNIQQGWTSKLANSVMRATMVEAWTNSLRRGLALNLSNTLDRMRKKDWGALEPHDRERLSQAGVTEDDWKVWQAAPATDYRGMPMLTKEGIQSLDAKTMGLADQDLNRSTARLLGYLDAEAKFAVLAPDVLTRAGVTQGTKAGTIIGEATRSVMLFKSFSFAIVDKNIRRIQTLPSTQAKIAYSVSLMTSLTLFGALAQQLKAIVAGKDPLDMTSGKFWAASFLQGGGLGIWGDILYTGMGGNAKGGQANWLSLLGPVFGTVADVTQATLGYVGDSIKAKNSSQQRTANRRAAGEAFRIAKSNIPGINLWYLRGVVDHMLLNDIQETISPGYARRMKQTAKRDFGASYWWEPDKKVPTRAPSPEAAVGGN